MKWQVILAAMLTVLLMPAVAGAACAWVLWQETKNVYPHRIKAVWKWHILAAVETKTECMESLVSTWQRTLDGYEQSKQEGTEIHSRRYSLEVINKDRQGNFLSQTAYSFLCLPDTVDPRKK